MRLHLQLIRSRVRVVTQAMLILHSIGLALQHKLNVECVSIKKYNIEQPSIS